jgi:flagellar hook-associated protein 3 FlgL
MRISTSDIFDPGALIRNQADMMKTQAQISSGRRIVSPADDPVGAAEALRLRQTAGLSAQYQANQQSALNTLGQAESVLGDVTTLLESVRTSVVAAGNGTLTDSDRQSMAQAISGQLDQLIGYANSSNAAGGYLFGGYSDGAQPFTKSASGVTYNGDQGGRTLQVSESRAIAVSSNGSSIFQGVPAAGNTFAGAAAPNNAGTSSIGRVEVGDATALLAGHTYSVQFAVSGGSTTYTVNDTTTGTNVAGQVNVPYTSGSAISFNGIQFSISGQPSDTDIFDVKPAATQSVFDTLQKLVDALNRPVTTAADRTTLGDQLQTALGNIDNAHNQALAVRASMGSRLQEIQSLQNVMGARDTATQSALSKIEDLDYAAAISTLSQQQLVLEAAQKSYVGVTHLSLFSLL